ncbi:3-dehydroquinate synthase [uncultured Maribacter sp.]|uniref:3-dehydroquinate synthase n=1 Tax=uncultured Maribacter sp. TaxID=431308 RepID=UPI002610A7FF|nr:3-dehydroquinate synthase [uncultured Maribacter sp.]
MKSIATSSYSIHFNEDAFKALNTHLEKGAYSTVFILVDENTHEHCLPMFMSQITGDYSFEIIEIVSGEENKHIETCLGVWNALSELGGDRKSIMLNLGGGVLTDLGGFVASTFKRGIHFINIPTTLLSMVDASVGGKTGVDLGPLKNQVGVINQPQMVLIVPYFLQTLEDRQVQSGFAEMLKHGLIKDEKYWSELKKVTSFKEMEDHIHDSVIIKNDVVTIDPTEQNLRKILNYGHTLGHAVESHYLESKDLPTLLHGEAIAIGMILEGYLSYKLTGLPKEQLEDIKETFLNRYPKIEFADADIESILKLLKFDKKNSHGNINFVLLNSIGKAVYDIKVSNDLYYEAFSYYKE